MQGPLRAELATEVDVFDELIWHGRDMLSRLEAEQNLTPAQRDSLPADQRVPISESQAWMNQVGARIQEQFGDDARARYRGFFDLFESEEVDELTAFIYLYRRIIRYLEELQRRLASGATPPVPPDEIGSPS
jgi:hypothetical protein